LQEGYTALIAAVSAGHYDCAKVLLSHKADVNLSDPVSTLFKLLGAYWTNNGDCLTHHTQDGLTPLMASICGGNVEVVKLILRQGANINSITVVRMLAVLV
jgi:ankyrin repeat protein